ncbi:MAG: polymer-forming cytoskeletal protein [Treponema sp.]|jgi:cytoskeletal protein CcmA (bactofilin family)|nr:polymer-forming cytoskeletal protein [Treponema sp.]
MTESRNETLDESDFDVILSNDIDFSGTARLEKPFLVRGKITGEILSTSLLVVDEEAVVDADITAPHVVIRGTVKGNVNASEKVHITLTGKLQGNITTTEICLESGALFNGRCSMTASPSPSVQETASKL